MLLIRCNSATWVLELSATVTNYFLPPNRSVLRRALCGPIHFLNGRYRTGLCTNEPVYIILYCTPVLGRGSPRNYRALSFLRRKALTDARRSPPARSVI